MFLKRRISAKTNSKSAGLGAKILAVFLLMFLVIFASYLAKSLYFLDGLKVVKLVKVADPVLSKAGVDSNKVATVAGDLVGRVAEGEIKTSSSSSRNIKNTDVKLKVAVMADSHEDNEQLQKALKKAQNLHSDFVVHLGDYTDFGDVKALEEAKKVLDKSGIEYYALPGDHDLAQSGDNTNYKKVFGEPNRVIKKNGVTLVLFDNSVNFTPISELNMEWFKKQVKYADFVFMSQPLFTSSNLRVMGIINGDTNENVYKQNLELLNDARNSQSNALIAGDLHASSRIVDANRSSLVHIVNGALLRNSSANKINLQSSRFGILTIYQDLSFDFDDILVD